MRVTRAIIPVLLLVLGLFVSPTAASQYTVAVVQDGPFAEGNLVAQVESQLKQLLDSGTTVRFKRDPAFDANWNKSRIRQVIQSALDDAQVDIILGMGALVTREAAKEDLRLSKPFVSTFVQRSDLFDIPYSQDKRSLKENLSFILIPQGAENDIRAFQKLVPVGRHAGRFPHQLKDLYLMVGKEYVEMMEELRPKLQEFEKRIETIIHIIPVVADLAQTREALPESVEAVLLGETPRLTQAQRRMLIERLTEHAIPVLSLLGHPDVELGALAALTPDIQGQIVRRIANNLNQLTRGVPVDDLAVVLSVSSKLLINGKTAVALGLSSNMEMRAVASYLHPEAIEPETQPLTLKEVQQKAEAGNTSLMISDSRVQSSEQDVQKSKSFLLPQVFSGLQYENINSTELEQLFLPDSLTTFGISVNQMIYDDRLVSGYNSRQRIYEGDQHDRERERLDVVLEASRSYLNLLLAQILYRIEAQNMRLTEDNLELAKVRYEVGYSGKDEVFRWEAELARGRTSLFDAEANVEAQQINLNRVLGVEQDLRWKPVEIEVDPNQFYFLEGRLEPVYRNSAAWSEFRRFAVSLALENAPEVQAINKGIEAQQIQLDLNKRRYFLPSFNAGFSWNYQLQRSPDLEGLKKDRYRFELFASYPLFEGGGRKADVKKAESEILGLNRQEKLAREFVEQRVRTALRRIDSSFPSIKFSRIAAESALKNLQIVQDKYAQGLVNVTDLLEAQNQSFTADQNQAAVTHNFMLDLMEFQRAISWFEDEKSEQQKVELFQRIQESVSIQ